LGLRTSTLEDMAVAEIAETYRGRRVLVTGHTGFKGSWLALWLSEMGARTTGLALSPPTTPSHWDLLHLPIPEHRIDIRDAARTEAAIVASEPEIIFHLAAQSLVRRSYRQPLDTWSTNVMGTANVLQACRQCPSVKAVVVVTSDKCYQNIAPSIGFRESDPLGGLDPYSASKAATELVAASYRHAYFQQANSPLLATTRAGNVIGGGDWSEDRLIPDLVRSAAVGVTAQVRSPQAIRPWQHVLDPLHGYLKLGQRLLAGDRTCADAWNLGPSSDDQCSVSALLDLMKSGWSAIDWQVALTPDMPETTVLRLDATKAQTLLGWNPIWSLEKAVQQTVDWYRSFYSDNRTVSRQQLLEYLSDAELKAA